MGAGQAGLATAKALLEFGVGCVVLEQDARVGETWRRRYDSLRLFTPARYDALPGLRFPGHASAYPTKDEVADYLEAYARHFELPVRTGVPVRRLVRGTTRRFEVETDRGDYQCDHVVVATGTYGDRPRLPEAARLLEPAIQQLHSSAYRRPSDLVKGPVLVVGASHSGCDIALELAPTRQVTLAGPDTGEVPLRWGAWPLTLAWPVAMAVGRHLLTRGNPVGRRLVGPLRAHGSPRLRVKQADLDARGVVRTTARVVGAREGRPLLDDGTVSNAATVIWATGFVQRFDWIDLPIEDEHGWPREVRGVAAGVPGLYFCGLAFQYSLASGDLAGVGADARYLARRIMASDRPTEHPEHNPPGHATPA